MKPKGLLLLSSGIDSPVAGYLMKKKLELEAVTFSQGKYSDNVSIEKTKKLAQSLGLRLHIIDIEKNLDEIISKCNRRFCCILCKRTMYRKAFGLAKEQGFDFLVTGESLGQVASQTLDNLWVLDRCVEITILRPLIGLDKQEIIDIAKEIGTYDISIIKSCGCRAVPKNPVTKAKECIVQKQETKLLLK